jgi:pyrimidine-nucleoside phosphorylase
MFNPRDMIQAKRDGHAFSDEQIDAWIAGYTAGEIGDDQMAALAMAICFQGMNRAETVRWTAAMRDSGAQVEFGDNDAVRIDKHSTGGVGDKISIPLAPLVAACGVQVPMISGRGLGYTGGTLDKLDSIPGYRSDLSLPEFIAAVRTNGASIVGQTAELAPADRKFYALRDVTATVACEPLIVASILSKKLCEGLDALVLDVKCGSGAFMRDLDSARSLARSLVDVAKANGVRTGALVTAMDQPIGRMIGNALEIRESIDILRGQGPADSWNLCLELGARMLLLAGEVRDVGDGRELISAARSSGRALRRFAEMIETQGGDPHVVDRPDLLPTAPRTVEVLSPFSDELAAFDAMSIARAAHALGAGRDRSDDAVDPRVGIELLVEPGEVVAAGQPVALLHVDSRGVDEARDRVLESMTAGPCQQPRADRVLDWVE